MDKEDGSSGARINRVYVFGSSVVDHAGTRLSTDKGATFEPAQGIGLMDQDGGSFDVRYNQEVLAAKNELVRAAPLAGLPFLTSADQGDTAGQYAKAIWKFGRTSQDYLLAPDAGGVGLYKIVSDVRTDISPNDGNVGYVLNAGCLAMHSKDNDNMYALMNFGGSIKLAYSDDVGASWDYNTDPTANATWVDANPRNVLQVYVSDDASIWYSQDSGATLTEKAGPVSSLLGVAVL